MPSNHDRDKPWDTEEIDKWKIEEFTPADNPAGSFAEESSFKVLFPKYRETYLREAWPLVTRALDKFHIACALDLVEGSMTVRTTLKTYDPAAILKARDLIKLLARAMPLPQAMKILEDGIACDVIKTRGLVRNREKFQKRRQRILGPNGSTLKALEMLTGCTVVVQGGTVAAIGGYKGLKELRRVVEDCMDNVHPIYRIKELMIKRELAKDPALKHEDWTRFLPQFKPRTLAQRKKPQKITDKSKKTYTPFPPAPEKSKVDLQIESGEYFLSKQAKEFAKREEREEKRKEKKAEKQKQRELDFMPPPEEVEENRKAKKRKREGETEEERRERKERKREKKEKREKKKAVEA